MTDVMPTMPPERKRMMRKRKVARLLVVSPSREVLLFRFSHTQDALAGSNYWATPGGGLEEGETFHAAAMRELHEETGLRVSIMEEPVADRSLPLLLPDGETVLAVEQYFLVHTADKTLSRSGWSAHEMRVMTEHCWWSMAALKSTRETVWPENLVDILTQAGVFTL